jgi:hypothetical protein
MMFCLSKLVVQLGADQRETGGQLNTYYNAIHPRDVPYAKWQVRLQVVLLFPAEK